MLRIDRLVATMPGQMALTVIPHGATSIARARVKPMIAAFEAEYAVERGAPTRPAIEEMLTIRPQRRCRMTGTANRDIRYVPRALMRMTSSQTATGTSSMSWRSRPCGAAALLTSTSSRPWRDTASSTMPRASPSSPMSPVTAAAAPPAALISSTTLSRPRHVASPPSPTCSWRMLRTPVGTRSATTTAIPSAASVRAIARPMPSALPQPVTRATRRSPTAATPPPGT